MKRWGGRVAHVLHYVLSMRRRITQRELRNESGRIMRDLDKGKAFVVTRNGVPVGELSPVRQRVFVPSDAVRAAFEGAPRVARARFRRDVDAVIVQDATPRG
jgi:antitoxin (DNA-binding transcriptional repressor) of toxin-antitoxin stability system